MIESNPTRANFTSKLSPRLVECTRRA